MASFLGKPSQRHYGILTFSTSFLLLLRCIVFLSPPGLFNMQPIQHRPPATNTPGLFRHIIDAAIDHIVILLCAGFFGTFRCTVFKELLMVQQFRLWALQEGAHQELQLLDTPSQKNRSKYFFPQIPTFDIDARLFLRDQQSLVASALTFVVFPIRRLPLLELSFESHLKFRHA